MPDRSNTNETVRKGSGTPKVLLPALMVLAWVAFSFQVQAQSFAVSGTVRVEENPASVLPKSCC